VGWNRSGAKVGGTGLPEIFWVVPLRFLALKVHIVGLVSAFVMVSIHFGQFLVCCSFTHGALPPCPAIFKTGGHAPMPNGVGAAGCSLTCL